jgi:hypothetical protein
MLSHLKAVEASSATDASPGNVKSIPSGFTALIVAATTNEKSGP